MLICKRFTFEAAHWLPNVELGHKCRRLHGHSFAFTLHLDGELVQPQGWVQDFGDIGDVGDKLAEQLDHRLLNGIRGLENPTAENIAVWLWHKAKPELPQLCYIDVEETCSTSCRYSGE